MIGLLSSVNNPLLGKYIEAIEKVANAAKVCLILDPKPMSARDISIIHYRTRGFFRNDFDRVTRMQMEECWLQTLDVAHIYADIMKSELALSCDFLINIGTPRKLKAEFLDLFDGGVINIHPGFLPNYRGSSAVEWSLLERSGIVNTIHYMDPEYDSGPIIAHCPVHISTSDDYFDIRIKVHLQSISLVSQLVSQLTSGLVKGYTSFKQSHIHSDPRSPVTSEQLSEVIKRCANGFVNIGLQLPEGLIYHDYFKCNSMGDELPNAN